MHLAYSNQSSNGNFELATTDFITITPLFLRCQDGDK